MYFYYRSTSALVYTLVDEMKNDVSFKEKNLVAAYVYSQVNNLPDFLKLPFFFLSVLFELSSLIYFRTFFPNLSSKERSLILDKWRQSKLGFRKSYVKYHVDLTILCLYSLPGVPKYVLQFKR